LAGLTASLEEFELPAAVSAEGSPRRDPLTSPFRRRTCLAGLRPLRAWFAHACSPTAHEQRAVSVVVVVQEAVRLRMTTYGDCLAAMDNLVTEQLPAGMPRSAGHFNCRVQCAKELLRLELNRSRRLISFSPVYLDLPRCERRRGERCYHCQDVQGSLHSLLPLPKLDFSVQPAASGP
jgi:hypothetical protein